MARRLLRQRFGSPAMAIALGIISLLTALQAGLGDPERALQTGILAIVLIAAGSVGRDASGGALQMILARPIRRNDYLFGRYLGILAAYGIYLAVTGLFALLLAEILPRLFGAISGAGFSLGGLGRGAAAAILNGVLFSAILLFFSTFLRGYADVLAYVVLMILLGVLPGLGRALQEPWLARAGETIRENVLPEVDWSAVLRGVHPLGEATGRWVLAVTAFLILASVIFSRREFAYGQD